MPIRCLTFDLDDTLWDCAPVLSRAEEVMYAWVAAHHPVIAEQFTLEALIEHRRGYFADFPHLHHDYSRLRTQWLVHLARETGCDEALAEAGFQVFWRARNEVAVFEAAVDALSRLGKIYRIGAITNGNADVHHIGIGHLFDFVITAAGAGAAKPSPVIFEAALDEAGVSPGEAVHIGDDPQRDVLGARAAGMVTVWVNPAGVPWMDGPEPDAVIREVGELPAVLARWEARGQPD